MSQNRGWENKQAQGREKAVTVTESGDKVGLDVTIQGGSLQTGGSIITEEFDNIQVTATTADGCPQIVEYRMGATVVSTITITYDGNGNLQSVVKS